MMDRETGLAYQQLLESRISPNISVSTDTLIELLRELLTKRRSLHVRRKLLFKSFGKRGRFSAEGANTESFISELVKEMEDCKMESFQWTDLPILIMINSLRSSDENEARLAERLTHIYNSSILSNTELDMSFVRGEISQFWGPSI